MRSERSWRNARGCSTAPSPRTCRRPDHFRALAREIAASAGMSLDADLCILNYYPADGRMGLHQDKDEGAAPLAAGIPVVSVSLGDTARFLFGGLKRRDPVDAIPLESGDAFVFGGPARLRYHGVSRIIPHTAPPGLHLDGRLNLTFRRYEGRALRLRSGQASSAPTQTGKELLCVFGGLCVDRRWRWSVRRSAARRSPLAAPAPPMSAGRKTATSGRR